MQRWSPEEFAPGPGNGGFALLRGVVDQPGAGGFRAEFRAAGADDPLARLTPAERDLVRGRLTAEVEAAARQRDGEQLRRREEEMQALLDGLAASLEAEAQAGLESVARAAADLALAVAERIVRREVAADPDVLTRSLEDVLLRLRAGASLTLTAHPEDAAWLEAQPDLLSRLRVAAIQPDRRLARGGCLAVADRREWDATIAGQLAALSEAVEAALANAVPTGGALVVPVLPCPDVLAAVRRADPVRPVGRVEKLVGLIIEVGGLAAPVGSLCRVETGRNSATVLCEVVGFRGDTLLLMPYGTPSGLGPGQRVLLVSRDLTVPFGNELLGRVLNGLGEPIDGGPPLGHLPRRRTGAVPPPALSRRRCEDELPTGVRAIDALITVARGQRLGIFAGSGVGKSVLLGMLARNARVDVNVMALIGERGREVREFIERDLGPEGLARSVLVVVTSDESAVMRAKGAETAMAIAESFRDADRNVLFLMDSATRYAMALREIGLAAGEPPTTKGYTPSVFAALPRLCERAGWSAVNAMTAFFTVLIEGDDIHDPVGDAMRSILDGHVMLSRDLAREGHYPAIDVLGSISRLRHDVVAAPLLEAGGTVLRWLKALEENRDLINIGAYAPGSDPLVDAALARQEDVRSFLRQAVADPAPLDDTYARLRALAGA